MVLRAHLGGVLVVAAFAAPAPIAQAADAFLCGPANVVYVEAEDLARMKRTDACIAGHYGLTIAPPLEAAAPAAASMPAPAPTKSSAAKIAHQRSAKLRATQNETAVRPEPQKAVRHAAIATQGTDYRNVRVLNPQTPEAAWFHHDK